MKGMGQIVAWSVRDESLHTDSIIRLFKVFISEHPEIWDDRFKEELGEICDTIISHEDAFIALAFEMGDVQGLSAEDVRRYIRYIGNRRLRQLGLNSRYPVEENPLLWMDEILNGVEHVNFFENRATEYTKAATTGTWETAFMSMEDSSKDL
jgi:ribonucleoside-diphosphate reductase beta chain